MATIDLLKKIENEVIGKANHPEFHSGDTISVHYTIKEGGKERIQVFQGIVIQKKGTGSTRTFTVRKISDGIGVERIFPLYSPSVSKIEVKRKGKVNRARIFYMRGKIGTQAKVKEKRV